MSKKKTTIARKNSKAVQKLQKNEKKYTIYVVGLFLALFFYLGYIMLIVPDKNLSKIQNVSTSLSNYGEEKSMDSVSVFSEVVTLTEENIMSNEDGLASNPYLVSIKNPTTEEIKYRIILKSDSVLQQRCGCDNRFSSYIIVGTDKGIEHFSSMKDSIIYEGNLMAKEEKTLSFRLWFDQDIPLSGEAHFHGKFELEF